MTHAVSVPPAASAGELGKQEALLRLGRKRQTTQWPGYGSIGEYHGGVYDGPQVSPYTRGAGNADSPIFLILQDWCDESYLERPVNPALVRLGRDESLPTNINLARLLQVGFGSSLAEVYATNLFPFVKRGGMSSALPHGQLLRAAQEFTIPEMRIVRPRLVICLGAAVFRAMHEAITGRRYLQDLNFAIGNPIDFQLDGLTVRLWAQAHPGALGLANRGRERAEDDWRRMGQWLRSSRPCENRASDQWVSAAPQRG